MAIYRGIGGAGDSNTDATVTAVTEQAVDAAQSATEAATSATQAATSAASASSSATNASSSASSAATSATNAASHTTAAANSATSAATSATAASVSETNAAASETAAATSETNAAASEASAETDAATATTKASEAATSASEAASSAEAADTSHANAAMNAANAFMSQQYAAASETAAATSESNAASSETAAAASAIAADASANDAASSEANAASSETASAASAASASTSATTATTQATAASTSASAAATSASNAATSESNAATSETNASASESAAASSATAAQAAQDAALAALDSFDDRYLGTKTSDPTLDNDGNALIAGALYFNTTDDVMKVYEGSSWVAAYASLSGALLQSNNLSDVQNVVSARTNLGLGTAAITAATDYVAVTGDSMTGNLTFGDNDKAIFGAGSDLQIYHDGGASYIKDDGTGSLSVQTNGTQINLYDTANSNMLASFINGGANNFYYNGSPKLATTSTGIDVTGTATMDGLTVDGDINAITDAVVDVYMMENDTTDLNTLLRSNAGDFSIRTSNDAKNSLQQRLNIDHATGDISFYEDTGTTAKFFWDSSAERLGIGNTAPDAKLHLTGSVNTNDSALRITNNAVGSEYIDLQSGINGVSNAGFQLGVNGTARLVVNDSGNVGIGTSSPSQKLHVNSGGANYVAKFESTDSLALVLAADSATTNTVAFGASGNNAVMYTDNTEAMRIDSSGNLLVGKTSTNFSTGGFAYLPAYDVLQLTRSDGNVMELNRTTSDGDFVRFYKDASQVGSIGTVGSDLYIGSGGAGVRFYEADNSVIPCSSAGVASNGAIDIGDGSFRFKDLYLSGSLSNGSTSLLLQTL